MPRSSLVSRWFASASAVDQMLEYAMGQRKSNPDMAVDVLLSGLSYSSPEADPLGAARLHLAVASVEAERLGWAKVQSHAGNGMRLALPAAAKGAGDAAGLAVAAGGLAVRAALVQGADSEAVSAATELSKGLAAAPGPAQARALGLAAIASAASGAASTSASVGELAAALAAADAPAGLLTAAPEAADSGAALGLLRLAEGPGGRQAAGAVLAAAAAAAKAAAAAAPGLVGKEAWAQHSNEVEAECLALRAQLHMAAREWSEAEELLGQALKAAEAAHGERSPALAPLLTLLGYTYSRSARVTFGEGLYREAAKLLRLDPARIALQAAQHAQQAQHDAEQGGGGGGAAVAAEGEQRRLALDASAAAAALGVHASVAAVLSWRHAQLLWVLPNRGGEAERWEKAARYFWAGSGGAVAGSDPAAVLGGQGHLKGEGPEGQGLLLSSRFRRALPCA
ncbi:hypothetical protein HYH03_007614 [Edaphochlamys debaryana]|uniref:Uncharacterized protein n=1 Tax=Edaphochlamys debaryana TaxID=47281 RepID=A0A836C0A5_9CHLO|nr:hypothetical protein HYH03_007614 [Edaphochlamys debaryana]|eukprot:KAG2494259.1 hypothetical protein HYH03_007614 [Edaphochlamys debaryana]